MSHGVQGHNDNNSMRVDYNHVSNPAEDDVDRIAPVAQSSSGDDRSRSLDDDDDDDDDNESVKDRLVLKPPKAVSNIRQSSAPLLRYRRTSVWLLACYLPFLILPWILTNIMADPPSLSSYYVQKAEHCRNRTYIILFWFIFVRVLNSIASVLVVPSTSALLAHGAVVYTQRRKAKQKLDLRQTFALSDHGWTDPTTIWSIWKNRGSPGLTSRYLKAAIGLLLLSIVQAPIQQALVTYEITAFMSCADHPLSNPPVLGLDPEPQTLALTPQIAVVPDLIKSLATVTEFDQQPYLWHDGSWSSYSEGGYNTAMGSTFFVPYQLNGSLRYYVTAFPNNTDTGVLREHIMRLNSSAECNAIEETAFPKTCSGPDPLTSSYNHGGISIDVCVPGNLSASPWTLSRDRQDIMEDLYIKTSVNHNILQYWGFDSSVASPPVNFTVHCTANTTRGYFELPNWQNDFTAGPLLEKWPDKRTLENDFNDYLGFPWGTTVPSTVNTAPEEDLDFLWQWPPAVFGTEYRPTPGPLATAAIAMFGQGSFFYVAKNSTISSYPTSRQQICQAGNIPFLRFRGQDMYHDVFNACTFIKYDFLGSNDTQELAFLLNGWIAPFNPANEAVAAYASADGSNNKHLYTREMLEMAMYFANLHWLLEAAKSSPDDFSFATRNIWSSPGVAIAKPVVPLYAKVTVSLFMLLQLFGLAMLMRYIYSIPTWTEKLDSCAVAQLTHDVNLPVFSTIRKADKEDMQSLKQCSGIVGVVEDNMDCHDKPPWVGPDAAPNEEQRAAEEEEEPENQTEDGLMVARGASGFITRQHATFQDWKLDFKNWRPRLRKRGAVEDSILEKAATRQ